MPVERDREGKSEGRRAAWPLLLEDVLGRCHLLLEGPRWKKGVDYLTSPYSQRSQHLLHLETNCTCLYQFLCITENPTMEQARVLFRLVLAFSHMKKLTIFSRDSLGPPRIHRSPTSIGPPRVHTFSLMSKSPFIFLSLKVTV